MPVVDKLLVVLDEIYADLANVPDEAKAAVEPGRTSVLIVAPALVSRVQWLTGGIDDAAAEAERRLQSVVEQMRAHGVVDVTGQFGDDDPSAAVTQALEEFEADLVQIFVRDPDHPNWQERRMMKALEPVDCPIQYYRVANSN